MLSLKKKPSADKKFGVNTTEKIKKHIQPFLGQWILDITFLSRPEAKLVIPFSGQALNNTGQTGLEQFNCTL